MLDVVRIIINFKSSLKSVSSLCLSKYSPFGVCYEPYDTNLQPQKPPPWNKVLRVKPNHSSASEETLRHFVEAQGSLPCSEALAIFPLPQPDKPSPHILISNLLQIYCNITLQSTPRSSMSLRHSHQNPCSCLF
jgi:hypothetical protein